MVAICQSVQVWLNECMNAKASTKECPSLALPGVGAFEDQPAADQPTVTGQTQAAGRRSWPPRTALGARGSWAGTAATWEFHERLEVPTLSHDESKY